MEQKKKVIVITGASSGIGLETANYLHQKGYKVYGIARRDMQDIGFEFIKADVCDNQQMKQALQFVYEKEQQIDVVINNAGMGISGAVEHTEKTRAETIFDVNTLACMDICSMSIDYLRRVLPHLMMLPEEVLKPQLKPKKP